MTTVLRMFVLVVVPLALAAALLRHPAGGDPVFEGVSPDVDDWIFVHTALLLAFAFLTLAVLLLLEGVQGLAATVSRVAVVFFAVFYTAYEVTIGLGTGYLVDHANGLPAAEQAVVADAIQDYNRNAVLAEPASISLIVGFFGWVVALVAAAVALRRAGAGWPATVLVGLASLFAIHPPPVGPAALVCLASAGVLLERARRRSAAGAVPASPAGVAPG
jgi:hypothetical protein